jgi:hypothetical protein
MLSTSLVLSKLIEQYVATIDAAKGGYRLIVPGLTPLVAEQTQEIIRLKNLRSYIVAEDDPSEERRRLLPVSLTTMRISSFIAIAEPGALADIRDSIRGSGGAVRSVAFTEEWPWIAATNESFDFKTRFLPELLNHWNAPAETRKWLESFIGQVLVKATVGDPQRSKILFESILGRFAPEAGSGCQDIREHLLMHCGVPKPPHLDKDASAVGQDTVALIRLINARVLHEEGIRKSLHENVAEDDPNGHEVHHAIDVFVDGLSNVSALGNDVLALRDCWGPEKERPKNWNLLSADRLRKLFELQEQPVELDAVIASDPSLICRDDAKQAAGFSTGTYNLQIRFSMPEGSFAENECRLKISSRRQTLETVSLSEPAGRVTVSFCPLDRSVAHKNRIPIKISLLVRDVERAKETLALHCCGDERPAFVLVTPIFRVEDLSEQDDDEEQSQEKRVVVEDPVKLHIFRIGTDQPTVSRVEGEQVMLTNSDNIWSTACSIDALREATSQVTFSCNVGERSALLSFEAQDNELGEFTVEDELRELSSACKKDKVKRLLDCFTGQTTDIYNRLGGIDTKSRRRIRYARLFEQRSGWQPILANLFAAPDGPDESCGSYARKLGPLDSSFLHEVTFATHDLELLREYEMRRDAFMQAVLAVTNQHSLDSQHPDYCLYPYYVAGPPNKAAAHAETLAAFLHAFARLQERLQDRTNRLSWSQLFILSHLDCLVHWGDESSANVFSLVGPWHPLVAAKRYLVQRALVKRAERLVAEPHDQFCSLIASMAQIAGFHWLPVVHRDHEALEPAYVSPTSDPGWHIAFSRRALEPALGSQAEKTWLQMAIESLKALLGLSVRIHLPSSGAMVGTALRSYAKSFPSKRHLSVFFPSGFSGYDEVAAADSFLHGEDSPTFYGLQLSGGINLSFLTPPEVPEATCWTNPSLKVFRYSNRRECIEAQYPDLQFAEVSDRIEFIEISQSMQLPRGQGDESVFDCSLSRLKSGRSLVPQSASEEWDSPSTAENPKSVGDVFLQCCSLSCQSAGAPLAALFATSLPARLDTAWTIVPGAVIDPAVFVRYVRDGHDRRLEERALWDYRVSLGRGAASYFILSTIPAAFRSAVNGLFGDGIDHASKFVTELGEAGLAIAGEAMKSGRHALGAVGLVAAVRLLIGGRVFYGPLAWSERSVGFVLPVDSFREVLQGNQRAEQESSLEGSRKRADLLAVFLSVPPDDEQPLRFTSVAFECKFTLGTFPDNEVEGALSQARATADAFTALVNAARLASGIPERLALVQLVRFGLRATSGKYSEEDDESFRKLEAQVYRKILLADFEVTPSSSPACLVSSEMGLAGAAEANIRASGLWVRLNRTHWPDIHDSESVASVRGAVASLFGQHVGHWAHEADVTADQVPSGASEQQGQHNIVATPESEAGSGSVGAQDEEMQPVSESHQSTLGSNAELSAERVSEDGVALQRIRVGVDASRTSHYFDPHSPTDRLENVNVMVTGSSGKGKTQFLKYLMSAAREQSANVLVLDFKNDFVSDAHFIQETGLRASVVTFDGLPFNPLIPFPVVDSRTGNSFFQCAQHIEGIAALLRRTYGGGDQQQADVKLAIRQAFSEIGVDPLSSTTPYDPSAKFPDFSRVGELLSQSNRKAYNRLDPLFTLGLFKAEFAQTSFAAMVTKSLALDLSQIPSDPLKNTLAELVVLSAHSYYNSQQHCGDLRQMFVVDEAHRILQADYLQRFALECRAYGLSLVLSSQYPSHFPTDISASMATKVVHGNGRDLVRIKEICGILGCAGREAEVAELGMFEAIYSNKHSRNSFLRTIAYPHYLVLKELRKKGQLTVDQIPLIAGIDTAKLSAVSIIKHLEKLGLCELRDGIVSLL